VYCAFVFYGRKKKPFNFLKKNPFNYVSTKATLKLKK